MKTYLFLISILIAALLLSACSPEDLAGLGVAGNPQPQSGGERQDNQSGQTGETGAKGQIETMIGEGRGNINSPGYPAADDGGGVISSDNGGGTISSDGSTSGAAPSSDQAGQMPSNSAESSSGQIDMAKPVKWLSYVDEAAKFSIQYPDSYVILPEIEPQSGEINLKPIKQVRFQDRQLASADTAALEQAQFTVEVFTFPGQTALEAFIKTSLPFPNMAVEPYTYGKLTGLRASTNRMLAPNEFYFFTGNGMVYKLTPLGQYSTEMLQSFTILP